MIPERRYAIFGTGAVGSLYGALLQRSGRDVHFLVRSDYDQVRACGLRVESIWGDVVLEHVSAYRSPDGMPPCDVVCVCTKTTENASVPRLLRPLVRPGTAILLMQNGLGAEEEIAAVFPEAHVAGALCFLCSNRVGPGHIRHIDYGKILLAAHKPRPGNPLEAIRDDLARAGIPVEISPNLGEARWRKLYWNIPFNGLCTVLGADTAEVMAGDSSRALARDLLVEVHRGAHACGFDIEDGFIDEMMDFTQAMKPYRPSMLLDHEARRPMEIEYIYERPIIAAQSAGTEMPCVRALARELRFLDNRNAAVKKP